MVSKVALRKIVSFHFFCTLLLINFLLYAQEPEFASLVYNAQSQGFIKPRTELFYANIPLNMEYLALSKDYIACTAKKHSDRIYFGQRAKQTDALKTLVIDDDSQNYFKDLKQIAFNSNQALLYVVQKKQIRCLENNASKTKYNIKPSEPINTYCKNYIITSPYNENDFIYTTGDNELHVYRATEASIEGMIFDIEDGQNILNLNYCDPNTLSIYLYKKKDLVEIKFFDLRILSKASLKTDCIISWPGFFENIPLMASCSINSNFAFTPDEKLVLVDRRNLVGPINKKAVLYANKWQELFFVGQTLVAISDEKIFFYDTVQDSYFEYPFIKNGFAKWHPHIQTLSISNPTTQETITYTFPVDLQQMQNIKNYTINYNIEPSQKKAVNIEDDVQELFNILDANNLSKSYVQKQYIKACDATIESVKGELCKDPTLVSKAKIALNGPIKKILHNKTDIITDKITYEKYREIVDQKNIIDDILTQLHDTDILAQCLICLDYFKEQISYGQTDNPTVLDCGHIVCKKCHTTLAEKQKDICPLCKK